MSYEFTTDEVREAVSAARFYSPGYTEEQFQASTELVKRLPESGYLGAVHSVAKLEKEKGVHCTETLDACQELLQKKTKLEEKVAGLKTRLEAVGGEVTQAQERLKQARQELQAVQAERQKEKKELTVFGKRAEKEKKRIEKELEQCRQQANVSQGEVVTAGQIKAQVESYGFSLKLVLDLSQEFVGHESAKEELAKALKKRQTLTNYIAALSEWAKGQKEALESELNKLKSEKDSGQAEIKNLEQARNQLDNIISQLQADVAYEEKLRVFYRRYYGWSGLLEWLASWEQIFFLRCNNPLYAVTGAFDRHAGGAHVWTDKVGPKCPHCGLNTLTYDEGLYQALNWPPGEPRKLQLGE